jgi:hypothetical protein
MTPSIDSRDRRALKLGMLVVAPALLWALGVRPYRAALLETRARVEQERALLERELALLAQVPHMPARIREAQRVGDASEARLFAATDVIEATSGLSSHVGRALRAANVVVHQVESRDAGEERNGVREVAIDVRAEGSLDGVLHALRALESGGRLLRISRIGVEKSLGSSAGAETLVLTATVRGYARLQRVEQ